VRNLLCWTMCALFPLSLFAADSGSAMLRSKGGVWVNGSEAPETIAIFSGDLIETKAGSVANLDAQGSSVLVQSESVVTLGDNLLTLDHGSVSVGTSTEMRVKVNCLTVVPVANEWTQYDVTDVNGTVQVVAHKLDVNITQGAGKKKSPDDNNSNSATVREGQTGSREESVACPGAGARPPGTMSGNPLSAKTWAEIGGGAGTIVLCVIFCRGAASPDVSPSNP
jgi:hypothetical protein